MTTGDCYHTSCHGAAQSRAWQHPELQWHWNGECWILALLRYLQRSSQGEGSLCSFPLGRKQPVAMGFLGSESMFEQVQNQGNPRQATQLGRRFRIQWQSLR